MNLPKIPKKPQRDGDEKKKKGAGIKALAKKKSFRLGTYTAATTVIVIIIAVIINMCVNALPTKYTLIDLTSSELYSITSQTEEVLQALEQEVTIYYIVQDGSEDAVVEQLLNNYKEQSNKITIEEVDPVARPTFASQYTSSTVYNNSLIVVSGDRSRYISYYDIYETSYTYDSSYNYTETTTFSGESALTSAIGYVTSEETLTAYVLEGHGEQTLTTGFSQAIDQENITTETLNLLTAGEIPDDCSLLIIFGPASDISSSEAEIIEEYLEGGGDMMLFTDCTDSSMTNLYGLMEKYGVEAVDGMVIEGNANYYAQGYANYLVPVIESHEITSSLISGNYYVLMPIAHGLNIIADDTDIEDEEDEISSDSLSVEPLLMTTTAAYAKLEGLNTTTAAQEDGDITTETGFALGVAITKNPDDGETNIVWFSSSYIANDSVNELVSGGNISLLTNAIDWLCDIEESVSIQSKTITYDYLTLTAAQTGRWSFIFVVLIPLAFIVIGIVVWAKRRKR